MDIKKAYSILEVSEDISDDDLKQKYKKLAVKYHPDVYKEDVSKFKTINEAYQYVQDYRANPHKYQPQANPFTGANGHGGINININDIFNGFRNNGQRYQPHIEPKPIDIHIRISFKDHILGLEKELTFKKNIKCETCEGEGQETLSNGCDKCDGFGNITQRNGNMIFQSRCGKCGGRGIKQHNCRKCNTAGFIEVETTAKISIPPGASGTLPIRGAGNYVGSNMFGDQYTDAHLHVNVIPDPDLKLVGNDVVFTLQLSLLDALTGCSRPIKTIFDTRQVSIPAGSRNKDEIHLAGCGIKERNGIQRVVLDISYPANIEGLKSYLKGNV